MNIKEILAYRNICPICSNALLLKSESPTYKVKFDKDTLKISYNSKNKYPEVILRKYCKKCLVKGKSTDSPAGVTYLDKISLKGYYYSFKCKIEGDNYNPEMFREYLSFKHNNMLNIIDNHFVENKLFIERFAVLDDRWKMQTVAKPLNSYSSIEDLIKLINLYITFS